MRTKLQQSLKQIRKQIPTQSPVVLFQALLHTVTEPLSHNEVLKLTAPGLHLHLEEQDTGKYLLKNKTSSLQR